MMTKREAELLDFIESRAGSDGQYAIAYALLSLNDTLKALRADVKQAIAEAQS